MAERMAPEALARLSTWLAGAAPGIGPLDGARRFSGGQSNPTWLVEAGPRRLVLRQKPEGVTLPSAHAIDREFRLLKALAGTAVPVPQPLVYCDDPDVIGAPFYLMAHVEGVVHWDAALPDQPRDLRGPVMLAMIDTLAALHGFDWKAAGLTDFGRPGDYAARQIARWTRQFRATEDGRFPRMQDLGTRLVSATPPEDGRVVLVHGDFRIDNLIYRRDSAEVLAVLDWELATIGHPFADLAYLLVHHRLPGTGVFHGLGGVDRRAAGLPDETAIIARYCAAAGLAKVPDLGFWIGLSAFRLAAILEGVRARIKAGNAADAARGRRLVTAIPDLIAIGLDALD